VHTFGFLKIIYQYPVRKFNHPAVCNMAAGRCSEKEVKMRKLRKLLGCAAVLGYFILITTVIASQTLDDVPSFRCEGQTISVGDRQYSVREACGIPQKISSAGEGTTEEWIYNFGPTRFIYYLNFVNGRLQRIQVGEYGFEAE
jgi:hypothetical protein